MHSCTYSAHSCSQLLTVAHTVLATKDNNRQMMTVGGKYFILILILSFFIQLKSMFFFGVFQNFRYAQCAELKVQETSFTWRLSLETLVPSSCWRFKIPPPVLDIERIICARYNISISNTILPQSCYIVYLMDCFLDYLVVDVEKSVVVL